MAVSVRDVAERAGVSVGTVSNVLNRPERVAAPTVERVQRAIVELGFVRNDAARQLRVGRSRSIGIVVLDVGNPFFTDIARGAETRAAADGYTVLLANSDERHEREVLHLDAFEQQRVHGVLLSPAGDVGAHVARLRAHGIPVVLVDRAPDDDEVSSVSVDDVAGGELATRHLLEIGRRRIAFLGGPTSLHQVADRLEGARRAVASVPGATLEVAATDALTVLEGRRMGAALAARAPADRPDAVFAANDLLAMGALQALVMQGDVRVPDDVALIGYDDIAFASAAVVPLSSVRQPAETIGERAIELLLRQAADPTVAAERVRFQPELVARASTVPHAGSAR